MKKSLDYFFLFNLKKNICKDCIYSLEPWEDKLRKKGWNGCIKSTFKHKFPEKYKRTDTGWVKKNNIHINWFTLLLGVKECSFKEKR